MKIATTYRNPQFYVESAGPIPAGQHKVRWSSRAGEARQGGYGTLFVRQEGRFGQGSARRSDDLSADDGATSARHTGVPFPRTNGARGNAFNGVVKGGRSPAPGRRERITWSRREALRIGWPGPQ